MERELNIYGDVSGWYIFDMMDRKAHEIACRYLKECLTANSSINFFRPLKDQEEYHIYPLATEVWFNKMEVHTRMLVWEEVIAIATFLFIKRK